MASEAQQALVYDKHNVTNNTAAIAFLLGSLVAALAEIVSEKLEETDSFHHVVWLELMNEIQVQTVERIESIKKEIKDQRPQQYLGQDLEKLAKLEEDSSYSWNTCNQVGQRKDFQVVHKVRALDYHSRYYVTYRRTYGRQD